jgi:hypothetical protein
MSDSLRKQGALYTMALPLTEYQQLILYDKLVIARGNYKINLF